MSTTGETDTLPPDGQDPLIKSVVEEFRSRFVPGGVVAYVSSAEDKFLHLGGKGYLAKGNQETRSWPSGQACFRYGIPNTMCKGRLPDFMENESLGFQQPRPPYPL